MAAIVPCPRCHRDQYPAVSATTHSCFRAPAEALLWYRTFEILWASSLNHLITTPHARLLAAGFCDATLQPWPIQMRRMEELCAGGFGYLTNFIVQLRCCAACLESGITFSLIFWVFRPSATVGARAKVRPQAWVIWHYHVNFSPTCMVGVHELEYIAADCFGQLVKLDSEELLSSPWELHSQLPPESSWHCRWESFI